MLEAADVSFSYGRGGRAVVDRVSLRIDRGDIVALLGPNGSGKTTLLRLLAGILRPDAGAVTIDGAPVQRYTRRELARRLAMVPQDTHEAFDFTVLDIALMGRYAHLGPFALESGEDLAIARAALAATGTADLAARSFGELSGGERQRVVIASALAQASDLLLLDEPTASLDLAYQLEIAALVRRLNRERGTTIVVCTHDLNLAAAVSGRVVLLKQGRVVACGGTLETLTAANIREVYGVDADVRMHPDAGHLTVVALGRPS
jgi:iron complex transport system ATP-binding protein